MHLTDIGLYYAFAPVEPLSTTENAWIRGLGNPDPADHHQNWSCPAIFSKFQYWQNPAKTSGLHWFISLDLLDIWVIVLRLVADMDSQPKGTMANHLEHSAQAETTLEVSSLPPKGEEFEESYTPEETKRLLRKIDMRVIPILAILYFLSFLDRGMCLSSYHGPNADT